VGLEYQSQEGSPMLKPTLKETSTFLVLLKISNY
jgi:hypothetical protein